MLSPELARFTAKSRKLFGSVQIRYDVFRSASQNSEWMLGKKVRILGRVGYFGLRPMTEMEAEQIYQNKEVIKETRNDEGQQKEHL